MKRMPVWQEVASKDNATFATVIWSALGLSAAGMFLEWAYTPTFVQVLADAAQTAARLLT